MCEFLMAPPLPPTHAFSTPWRYLQQKTHGLATPPLSERLQNRLPTPAEGIQVVVCPECLSPRYSNNWENSREWAWSGRLSIVLFVGELETKGFRKVLSYFVFTSQFLIAFHLPDASCLGIDKVAHPEGPLILSATPPGLYNLQNKRHKQQFSTDPCFWWRLSFAVLSFSSWIWISATGTACPINRFSLIS